MWFKKNLKKFLINSDTGKISFHPYLPIRDQCIMTTYWIIGLIVGYTLCIGHSTAYGESSAWAPSSIWINRSPPPLSHGSYQLEHDAALHSIKYAQTYNIKYT